MTERSKKEEGRARKAIERLFGAVSPVQSTNAYVIIECDGVAQAFMHEEFISTELLKTPAQAADDMLKTVKDACTESAGRQLVWRIPPEIEHFRDYSAQVEGWRWYVRFATVPL